MPQHNFRAPRGRTIEIEVDSRAVAGNVLGDPATRRVAVYLSAAEAGDRCPLLVDLTGFTGSGLKHLGWQGFGESVPQRVDRLIDEGRLGPVAVAFPDCFTTLGGNQYVNSSALGNWEDFLLDEMLPAVERECAVLPGAAHRAVFGKSSGGYGALIQALRHGDSWAAAACMSGDIDFETIYARDFPTLLNELQRHDGSIEAFLAHLAGARKIKGGEMHALMLLAMAATYDPDPSRPYGIRLPVDPQTCERIPERWQAWLAHDPLQLVERAECRASLARLGGLWLEAGRRDQYFVQYGTRRLHRRLEAFGIAHRYEEFDDDHLGIDYRMDEVLPFLYGLIQSGAD